MKCPFYAHTLHQMVSAQWVILPNPGSNQCALITDAHSPCLMEIAKFRPDWSTCPRNPAQNGTGPER